MNPVIIVIPNPWVFIMSNTVVNDKLACSSYVCCWEEVVKTRQPVVLAAWLPFSPSDLF